ncbi:MAG: type II secretion system protein GspK [Pirellulaceae bacterium]
MRIGAKDRRRRRSGFIILIVLVTIVLLSLAAYTFTSLMIVEDESSRLMAKQVQSRYLVDSGVDYVRLFLSADEAVIREKGGIYNNPAAFQFVTVGVDPSNPTSIGRFAVVGPGMDNEGNSAGSRFGLVDESSKINVNTLPYADNWVPGGGRQLLMALPEMTEEIADAILDWVDSDDDARDYGVEGSYYAGLSPGYQIKNGPMDSLDEILLVRGVTPQLLFGADSNRNGIIDTSELGDSSSLTQK